MKLRPEIIRFLEAKTMLHLADTEVRTAEMRYRQAVNDVDRAWDALTASEAEMVDDAISALEEPEMHR